MTERWWGRKPRKKFVLVILKMFFWVDDGDAPVDDCYYYVRLNAIASDSPHTLSHTHIVVLPGFCFMVVGAISMTGMPRCRADIRHSTFYWCHIIEDHNNWVRLPTTGPVDCCCVTLCFNCRHYTVARRSLWKWNWIAFWKRKKNWIQMLKPKSTESTAQIKCADEKWGEQKTTRSPTHLGHKFTSGERAHWKKSRRDGQSS